MYDVRACVRANGKVREEKKVTYDRRCGCGGESKLMLLLRNNLYAFLARTRISRNRFASQFRLTQPRPFSQPLSCAPTLLSDGFRSVTRRDVAHNVAFSIYGARISRHRRKQISSIVAALTLISVLSDRCHGSRQNPFASIFVFSHDARRSCAQPHIRAHLDGMHIACLRLDYSTSLSVSLSLSLPLSQALSCGRHCLTLSEFITRTNTILDVLRTNSVVKKTESVRVRE